MNFSINFWEKYIFAWYIFSKNDFSLFFNSPVTAFNKPSYHHSHPSYNSPHNSTSRGLYMYIPGVMRQILHLYNRINPYKLNSPLPSKKAKNFGSKQRRGKARKRGSNKPIYEQETFPKKQKATKKAGEILHGSFIIQRIFRLLFLGASQFFGY